MIVGGLFTFFCTCLPVGVHFQVIIITSVSMLTGPAILTLWCSRFEVTCLLRDGSGRGTRVRFAYVLPEVLHGDFFSEIKYLVNIECNILQISTINVNFFYGYSIEVNSHSIFSSFSCKQTEHVFFSWSCLSKVSERECHNDRVAERSRRDQLISRNVL